MAYFYDEEAQYKAQRIAALLEGTGYTALAAQRDGRVMVNIGIHIFWFTMDPHGNLQELAEYEADLVTPKQVWEIADDNPCREMGQ